MERGVHIFHLVVKYMKDLHISSLHNLKVEVLCEFFLCMSNLRFLLTCKKLVQLTNQSQSSNCCEQVMDGLYASLNPHLLPPSLFQAARVWQCLANCRLLFHLNGKARDSKEASHLNFKARILDSGLQFRLGTFLPSLDGQFR